jgi:DNA primase
MAFSDHFLQELSERCEIADVVSDYVRLTKKSGANLFGLCPFHSEKTPSFSVSPEKQIYHCFGCGKGGGVISFIMEMEKLSFADAVAFLARRAGMDLPEENGDETASKRRRMLELHREAARFYHEQFLGSAGAPARDYAFRRGISAATVKKLRPGVCS